MELNNAEREKEQRMTAARAHVALGVVWLDQHRLGWAEEINLDDLVLSHPCYCVLGQVGYEVAAAEGFTVYRENNTIEPTNDNFQSQDGFDYLVADWLNGDHVEAERLGFDLTPYEDYTFADLQEAWVEVIRERQTHHG